MSKVNDASSEKPPKQKGNGGSKKKLTYEEILKQNKLLNEAVDNYEKLVDEKRETIRKYREANEEKDEFIDTLLSRLQTGGLVHISDN